MQAAYDADGAGSFTWRVLEFVVLPGDLVPREEHWIQALKPAFNLSAHAETWRERAFTTTTRRRISAGLRGRPVSDATRQKISAANKGRVGNKPGVILSRKLTDEQVLYIRRRVSEGTSARAVARELGLPHTTVGAAARGESFKHLPLHAAAASA